MSEQEAQALALILGGHPYQSGGDIWILVIARADGKIVVVSPEVVCEYENKIAWDNNHIPGKVIDL